VKLVHISHQLGGYDGVSVEAAKWMAAFRQLGLCVTPAAGRLLGGLRRRPAPALPLAPGRPRRPAVASTGSD